MKSNGDNDCSMNRWLVPDDVLVKGRRIRSRDEKATTATSFRLDNGFQQDAGLRSFHSRRRATAALRIDRLERDTKR